jgi:hypothetical protein
MYVSARKVLEFLLSALLFVAMRLRAPGFLGFWLAPLQETAQSEVERQCWNLDPLLLMPLPPNREGARKGKALDGVVLDAALLRRFGRTTPKCSRTVDNLMPPCKYHSGPGLWESGYQAPLHFSLVTFVPRRIVSALPVMCLVLDPA